MVRWPRSHASEVVERQSSPLSHATNTEQTFKAWIGSGYCAQITRSHLEALISGFNTNVTGIHQSNGAPVYPERKLSIRWDPSSAACLGSAPPSWQAWIVSETAL